MIWKKKVSGEEAQLVRALSGIRAVHKGVEGMGEIFSRT
jgi:hypothetical protein